jgi:signal transduction histidine kinase
LKEVINQRPYVIGGFLRNKKVYRTIRKTLATKQKWQGVYTVIAKNGAEHSFDTLVTPVFNSRGKIVNMIGLCLDITQKIELQNQLNHAQKMEAVGRLSASFAHEFGNPLLGVRSVIKDISDRIAMEKSDRQLLKLACGECERMKVLIRDFQQFQRVSSGEKDFFDIHEILDNVLFFYKKHFEKNSIILYKEYDCTVPTVFVSKDQIAQVFLNLIINAVDAMSSTGGDLTITTRSQDSTVFVEVRDSGIGIEEDNKELIFEPFFTTKPEVHGTGLGLSISYGIVAGHGGEITFSSKINEGTRFIVQLPSQIVKN